MEGFPKRTALHGRFFAPRARPKAENRRFTVCRLRQTIPSGAVLSPTIPSGRVLLLPGAAAPLKVAIPPTDAWAMEARAASVDHARSALEGGDPGRALRTLQGILRDGAPAEELVEAARVALPVDARLARRLAEAALERRPELPEATHALAEALARLGLPGRAEVLFREAVAHDPRLADLRAPPDEARRPWIGRFPEVACPTCGEILGKPLWAGNITKHHRAHGLLDPVVLWVRCENCGLARVSAPPPTRVLDAWRSLSAPEPAEAPPDADALAQRLRVHDQVIERIREAGYGTGWVDRGERAPGLLDVGSRWGTFLTAAEWRGFHVTGFAPDEPPGARWARDRLGVRIGRGALPADLPEGPFDVVTCWGLLDRVREPMALLEALADRLETGGVLGLSVPTLDHPVHRALGYDDPLWCDPERLVWFDRESLAWALIRAGLQPIRAWHDHRRRGSMIVLAHKFDPER